MTADPRDTLAAIHARADAATDDIGITYNMSADEWALTSDKPTMQLLRHAPTDIPRLVAFAEAVLNLADEWEGYKRSASYPEAGAEEWAFNYCGDALSDLAREHLTGEDR